MKWIKGETIAQTYFVPVTTCRYPNQIVKIRVFPDMKWVFNFNYNIETPLYYKANTTLTEYYSGFNEGKIKEGDNEREIVTSNNNKRKDILSKSISNNLQHFAGRKTSFGLSVDCEVSGDGVISLSDEFSEKYRKMLSPIFWMVNKLDGDLGVSDARQEQARLLSSSSTKKGLLDRLTNSKFPMEFELKPPSLGAGIGIGYGASQKGTMSYELEGRIQANPIIGANVKLDILALGSKFKPWGAIIDALDIASWATNLFSGGRVELDYKIEVRFSAEVKLVGKKLKEAADGESASYEPQANFKYNFADKKLDFYGGIQGEILGEIEISFGVKLRAKLKDYSATPSKASANLSMGAEAAAKVTLTCPFELNNRGNLDVDFYFSGLTLKVWFQASVSLPDDSEGNSGGPDITKKLIDGTTIKKEIKF